MKTLVLLSSVALLTSLTTSSEAAAHRPRAKLVRVEAREPAPRESPRMAEARTPAQGLYIRGVTAGGKNFDALLDSMVARGINAAVLDAKDYDGLLTYPSKVALANESGAVNDPPIEDLRATIRQIHAKGIRVIMRVSCFNDEHLSHARPHQAVQSKAGRAYPIGWLDPSNEINQKYVRDLAREAIDNGADEIELDYVRYPVTGIHNADFHLKERGLTQIDVISRFVRDMHAFTKSRGVPLSLDIFGVVAFGKRADIDGLGQDPVILAKECEVLSPMVYPSHYTEGFAGFDVPGDHPELVGLATKLLREQIKDIKGAATIRPWLQAMSYESPSYSSAYVAEEVQSATHAGAQGWLMWNPGQMYGTVFRAVSVKDHAKDHEKSRAKSKTR